MELDTASQHVLLQLRHNGLIDEQFVQLMDLQDDENPHFLQEVGASFGGQEAVRAGRCGLPKLLGVHAAQVVTLYFEDSAAKLDKLGALLTGTVVDFNEVDQVVHQFKGSSASFGAAQIAAGCAQLRQFCATQDVGASQQVLAQLREQFSGLKEQLEVFMRMQGR
jgi:histidine-containing phosphotransfer peotein